MSVPGPNSHFIDLKDLPTEVLTHILETAKAWKQARAGMPKGAVDDGAPLAGHALAMIFEKSSTRTRMSFEMAMHQLGGSSLVMQGGTMQLGRGESVEDTARVISRYVDAVMVRANNHETLEALATHGSIPVINALTDRSHPCQLMADMLTLMEHFGTLEGLKVAWVGDGNNVATSFIEAATRFGFSLELACPDAYLPSAGALQWAAAEGGNCNVTSDPAVAVTAADVVVADCWVSMGDQDVDERMAALAPYQVNEALMAKAKDTAVFMHCLPAHRGEEVTAGVIDGPQSLVWQEAENRLHAQKAVLAWCLGKI